MPRLVALTISLGALGGLAAWLAAVPLEGRVLIWAVFVGWAAFFAAGGTTESLKTAVAGNLFGLACGWAAGLLVVALPVADIIGLPLWMAIVVALSVGVLALGTHVALLASVPASVLGYAAVFAYLLERPGTFNLATLAVIDFHNPLVVVGVSLVVGAAFGLISAKLADVLAHIP